MQSIALIVRMISRFNILLGHFFSWFSLGIVLVCFTVVVLRYVFSSGAIWLQDLYVWLNAMMFMGISGYALFNNSHVRVDIFYRPASRRRKAWVDMFGSLFFVGPFAWVLAVWSLPYIQRSWRFMEGSSNFGGMPGLYVIKTFVLVFAAVIALQALAMFLRGLLVLANQEDLLPEEYRYQEDH
ncbi:TRAP transporter small permease subunit [Marinospirillum perlucidum]|uniref:TRAP transporter small permease subunit n=1 Tax=Marinospirillum perlucidum TaxID=1982602 RepID=UPI000DF3A5F9|nr:TRAP transporter small permease subunit [Marinospirillum perlucidum]